ncbi:hypothetical protein N0V90_008054 [Kalmusia sp. IMI 367209]|nr:hypothetical protein N0V90_008054 [Kalmusia sp. IMI 367209]
MSSNPADAYAAQLKREREENPVHIDHLDHNVLAALPAGVVIEAIVPSGASEWCQTVRIDARLRNGTLRRYFKKMGVMEIPLTSPGKVQSGEVGRRMIEGTFQSESTYISYCPNHVPKPIAFGEYAAEPDTWFYLCEYHDMVDKLPEMKSFVAIVAKVHQASMGKSPTQKYGFHVPTHLANVPNDNSWQLSWETWYTQAMEAMFQFEKRIHGEDHELESLFKDLKDKVIPRLLRPLETGGHFIEPCLIHSDLWPGNCMLDADSGEIMIFDSCGYWGHNESDLGSWRAPRYRLGRPFMEEYQRIMGMSEPHGDWDDRNALYALAKKEMKTLIDKFPNGLREDDPLYAPKLEIHSGH